MASKPDMNMDWRDQKVVKEDGQWVVEGRPTNKVEVSWQETPANLPGKCYIGLKVTAPVNHAFPPHRHGRSCVSATVIKGSVLNQMICPDGHVVGPKIYEQGESWYEPPGCHHVRNENVGDDTAIFIAACVVEEQDVNELGVYGALVQIDAEMEERAKEGKS